METPPQRSLGYTSSRKANPEHPRNRELLAYWERKRTPGRPLLRAQFEPVEIPRLLPGIFLVEPVDGDYRVRLAGTDIETRMNRRFTGKTLMELYGPEYGPRTIAVYREVTGGTEPYVLRGRYKDDRLEHVEFEVLHLPLEYESGACGVLGGQFAFE